MSGTLAAALTPLFIALAVFEVYLLLDLRRAAEVRLLPKWGWALVVLLSIPLGGIAYLLFGKGSR